MTPYQRMLDRLREFNKLAGATLARDFQAALESEFGVEGHPKAEILYELAWDYGREGGLPDVLWHYSEMSRLLS